MLYSDGKAPSMTVQECICIGYRVLLRIRICRETSTSICMCVCGGGGRSTPTCSVGLCELGPMIDQWSPRLI